MYQSNSPIFARPFSPIGADDLTAILNDPLIDPFYNPYPPIHFPELTMNESVQVSSSAGPSPIRSSSRPELILNVSVPNETPPKRYRPRRQKYDHFGSPIRRRIPFQMNHSLPVSVSFASESVHDKFDDSPPPSISSIHTKPLVLSPFSSEPTSFEFEAATEDDDVNTPTIEFEKSFSVRHFDFDSPSITQQCLEIFQDKTNKKFVPCESDILPFLEKYGIGNDSFNEPRTLNNFFKWFEDVCLMVREFPRYWWDMEDRLVYGFITGRDVKELLRGRVWGTFVIRFSTQRGGLYVSYTRNDRDVRNNVAHVLLLHERGGYDLFTTVMRDGRRSRPQTLEKFIKKYKRLRYVLDVKGQSIPKRCVF